ncbi:hypothetical protein ACFCXA_19195 [Streptomyces virginiae]|uniref:competence protein CoiA family protein n=1 Tax=Streptomyces virginiae TaxID=1961 RepID=UPI0035DA54F6
MAHGVFHKELGEINLSELNLDDLEDRRLWESLYGRTRKGDLECLDCRRNDPGCPQWMFLRLWCGRPQAVHYTKDIKHPTAPESPRHRALKERIALAAENAGYSAELEARAPDGRRRTDVLVHGDNGIKLGCEIQLSHTTAHSVAKRSDIARSDGLSPLWTTDDPSAPLIDRAPWTRIDRMPEEILRNGNALLIRGGVKNLDLVRCDSRSPIPCPDRGYGRCNQWHGTWAPTRGIHIDQLIGSTAAGEYVALYLPAQRGRRRPSHMWVTAKDREQYLDATGETEAAPQPGKVDDVEPGAPENLPLSHECSYEQRLQEKKRRGSTPRDTGEPVATGITIPAKDTPPPPQSRPATFLTHVAAQHRTGPLTTIPQQRAPGPASPALTGTPPWESPEFSRQAPQALWPAKPSVLAPVTPASPQPATSPLPPTKPDRGGRAAQLGCRPDQIGPCAKCYEMTCKYGDGGNPLCRPCQDQRKGRKVR